MAAIVVFILLMTFSCRVLYGCIKNFQYLTWRLMPLHFPRLLFAYVILAVNLLTMATGTYFSIKKKWSVANAVLLLGILLFYGLFYLTQAQVRHTA